MSTHIRVVLKDECHGNASRAHIRILYFHVRIRYFHVVRGK